MSLPRPTPPRALRDLAHARSGDKGNRANVGVLAFDAEGYELLRAHLTPEALASFLKPLGIGEVRRYDLPHLHGFNFVIESGLSGGAGGSLRLDTQGKALAETVLNLPWPPPESARFKS
ncbi:hypothetical protein Isop_2489 [Isosphaera pallida ATCC 43644]|uniref:AtuA-like ferredoxin-fold domain-containing protein n=1 Tax=Isosphaera pallida (strain ATCC 43644 / DSM 9630 / IS1B) TaxID=575540 RepID=E8QXL3_ISOPI|nr:hypothetical protein [Isosphaera pallida]ADV63061.1 hypothetical protein Isop_2489 [Isosphaera pallida ATCC 43644]